MTTTAGSSLAVTRELLFTALGFTAIAMQDSPSAATADRARAFAALIEDFCRQALPEAFEATRAEKVE